MEREVRAVVELGVTEQSWSEWCSPIVLVPKTNETLHFSIDFRRVNAISKVDAYPMPQTDELLDNLGTAGYITTFDHTERYWQISCTQAPVRRPHLALQPGYITSPGCLSAFPGPRQASSA